MPISAANTLLSETASRSISPSTRAYFQARLRLRLYDLIMRKFRDEANRSGLTRAVLGRRIGKRPEVITRLLGAPGNWTLETVSDLLMGISGDELLPTTASPLNSPPLNLGYQDVLEGAPQSRGKQGEEAESLRDDGSLSKVPRILRDAIGGSGSSQSLAPPTLGLQ